MMLKQSRFSSLFLASLLVCSSLFSTQATAAPTPFPALPPGALAYQGCHMHVYKHATANNDKAIILLHGGGWFSRGGGVVPTAGFPIAQGFDTANPTQWLTEKLINLGYVVFIPSYKLALIDPIVPANDKCGTTSARLDDVTADVDNAFQWVMDNKHAYNANYNRVDVVGTSAGAHLALWLAFNRSSQIGKVFAVAPPSNFTNFVRYNDSSSAHGHQNSYYSGLTLGIQPDNIASSDIPSSTIELYDRVIYENASSPAHESVNKPLYDLETARKETSSFHDLVKSNTLLRSTLPHIMIIHGTKDNLVPIEQSIDFCRALADSEQDVVITERNAYSVTKVCGANRNKFFLSEHKYLRHGLVWGVPTTPGGNCIANCVDAGNENARIFNKALTWLSTGSTSTWYGAVTYEERTIEDEAAYRIYASQQGVKGSGINYVPYGDSYKMYAVDIPSTSTVLFPTWTVANGQDELEWIYGTYNATKNRWEATVHRANHFNEFGLYETHVYEVIAGQYHFRGHAYATLTPGVSPGPNGSHQDFDGSRTLYGVNQYQVFSRVVTGATDVQFATWTTENGHDDLNWEPGIYDPVMDRWTAVIDSALDHNNDYGLYSTHVWAVIGGQSVKINEIFTTIKP